MAMSVRRPSIHRSQFQLSLLATVFGVVILYCMVMVSSKGHLSFWVLMIAIFNSKWLIAKLLKKHICDSGTTKFLIMFLYKNSN